MAQALECKPTRASSANLQRGVTAAELSSKRLKAAEVRAWLLEAGLAVQLPTGRLLPTDRCIEIGGLLRDARLGD